MDEPDELVAPRIADAPHRIPAMRRAQAERNAGIFGLATLAARREDLEVDARLDIVDTAPEHIARIETVSARAIPALDATRGEGRLQRRFFYTFSAKDYTPPRYPYPCRQGVRHTPDHGNAWRITAWTGMHGATMNR